MSSLGNDQPSFQQIAAQAAAKYGIPNGLLGALIEQESGWNPRAVSPVGAQGLGQLMPATAQGLGVSDPFNPAQNIDGTARYLSDQLKRFGSVPLALAAYNAGPAAVSKYGGVPPYAETQAYVKSIMGNMGKHAVQGAGSVSLPAQQDMDSVRTSTRLPPVGGLALMNAIDSNDVVSLAQLLQRSQGRSLPPLSQAQPGQQKVQDTYIPIQGGALNGQTLMTVGTPNHTYKNLAFAGHTDWTHVNPRLLQIVDAQAKKLGKTATIISGYRSNHYSDQVGGFGGDPHTKGIAVDAYIDGHPIGDVIPPDVWAKLGVTSGNTPNFYKGKPDPEHLQITHVVLKGGKG